jgi:hypothetical protein
MFLELTDASLEQAPNADAVKSRIIARFILLSPFVGELRAGSG